jgi:hypothetical protein
MTLHPIAMINTRIHPAQREASSFTPCGEVTKGSPSALATPAATWVRTLQDWAVRIPYEATRPEMLLGMGGGALFFQAGRVLGLRAVLAGGLRGSGAVLLGQAAGLAAETTGFIAASRGALQAMGRPVTEDWAHVGREWLSMAFFLGALRSARGAVRQIYGAGWTPASPWQGFHSGLAQQGAMYGTLVGTAAAEWSWGWRDYQGKDHLLRDSLAMLGTFQIAGQLAHQGLGRHLAPAERGLEARARRWEQRAKNPWPLRLSIADKRLAAPGVGDFSSMRDGLFFSQAEGPLGSGSAAGGEEITATTHIVRVIGPGEIVRRLSDPQSGLAQELLTKHVIFQVEGSFNIDTLDKIVASVNTVTAALGGQGTGPPIPPGRKVVLHLIQPELNPSLSDVIEIISGREGFAVAASPFRPISQTVPLSPETTLDGGDVDALLLAAESPPARGEIAGPRPRQESSMLNIGEADRPIVVKSFLEFTRKARSSPESLQDDLIQHDRSVQLEAHMGFRIEFALQALNGLPRLADIPEGREVTFHYRGQEAPQVAVKRDGQFVDGAKRRTRATPASTRRGTPTPGADEPAPGSRGVVDPASSIWEAKHLPLFFSDFTHLPALLRQTAQVGHPASYPSLIFEGAPVTMTQLQRVMEGKLSGVAEGATWEIMAPANKRSPKSFMASFVDGNLQWRSAPQTAWKRAEGQALFATHIVSAPSEIFRYLEAISRDKKSSANEDTQFQHRGQLTPDYLNGLSSFILGVLHRYPIRGQALTLTNQEGKTLLQFRKEADRWELREGTQETARPSP